MSKKEIAVFSILVALVVGAVTTLLAWDFQNDSRNFEQNCQRIAKLSDAQDFYTEYGECYLVKDNKIVKVEL